MKRHLWLAMAAILASASTGRARENRPAVREDFASGALGKDWRVSNARWSVAGGELRGTGHGRLQYVKPLAGDLTLTFEAWTSEKANVEVKLIDPATGADRFTFAFLGVYHRVLKGVKCCMLKGNRFVSVRPDMWIYPGRRFHFEVRRIGGQHEMRLDGVLGPVFVDERPEPGPYLLRIIVSPEVESCALAVDNITFLASPAGGAAGRPAVPPAPPRRHPGTEATIETARTRNIVVKNHADASFQTAMIARDLQKMYEFLLEYVGVGPGRVIVHVGNAYKSGFARPSAPHPEMFLRADRIFDSTVDYAHEMMHCFTFRFGRLPHWFGESLSDVAYIDSEIDLYHRRKEEPFLQSLDRIDHRSFELVRLRRKFGRAYFPKVFRLLEKRRTACQATFRPDVPLERRNRLILSVLSEAAGEDLNELFRTEFGFDPRTRERQRGY